jgi:hypothetical protein
MVTSSFSEYHIDVVNLPHYWSLNASKTGERTGTYRKYDKIVEMVINSPACKADKLSSAQYKVKEMDIMLSLLNNCDYMFALRNVHNMTKVIGYSFCTDHKVIKNLGYLMPKPKRGVFYLQQICTVPNIDGLGTCMMNYMVEFATDILRRRRFELIKEKSTSKFYHKLGFQQTKKDAKMEGYQYMKLCL